MLSVIIVRSLTGFLGTVAIIGGVDDGADVIVDA